MSIDREFHCSVTELEDIFEKHGNSLDLNGFLFSQSKIYVTEKDYDQIEEKSNKDPFFRKIIKSTTSELFSNLSTREKENPSIIYISSDTEMEKSGYVCLSSDNFISEYKKLQHHSEQLVFKDENYTWSDLLNNDILPNLNSLVIIDKYLLKTKQGIENLKGIIFKLIPENLESDFYFTFIGDEGLIKSETDTRNETKKKMERIQNELSKWISQEFPKIKPKVSILLSGEYHNRWIISNHFRIKSQHGFNLIKGKKVIRDSDIDIKGSFYSNNYSQVKLIKEFAKIKKSLKNKTDSKTQVVFGSENNKLLDYAMEFL